MTRFDLVTIGELLYVLRAPYPGRLEQTPTLSCHVGGAEANVAIGVTRLGWSAALVTKVTDNFIGRFAVNGVRGAGVDVSRVIWTDAGRMGLLFQELGVPPRPAESVNDRLHSAFTQLAPEEVDWTQVRAAKRLFVSGVTAALGDRPRQLVRRAVREAKSAGTQVVFDCNHRARLWSTDEARAFVAPLLDDVDVLFLKADEARSILGLAGEPAEIVERLRGDHGIEIVVLSLGGDGAIASDGTIAQAPAIPVQIVNRFGMGDAFIAGFLYGHASRRAAPGPGLWARPRRAQGDLRERELRAGVARRRGTPARHAGRRRGHRGPGRDRSVGLAVCAAAGEPTAAGDLGRRLPLDWPPQDSVARLRRSAEAASSLGMGDSDR